MLHSHYVEELMHTADYVLDELQETPEFQNDEELMWLAGEAIGSINNLIDEIKRKTGTPELNKLLYEDDKEYTWIIGVCSSDGDDVTTWKVRGTKSQVREYLFDLVEADKYEDYEREDRDEGYEYGTESLEEVEDRSDPDNPNYHKLYAYNNYADHHIDYTATTVSTPIQLPEGDILLNLLDKDFYEVQVDSEGNRLIVCEGYFYGSPDEDDYTPYRELTYSGFELDPELLADDPVDGAVYETEYYLGELDRAKSYLDDLSQLDCIKRIKEWCKDVKPLPIFSVDKTTEPGCYIDIEPDKFQRIMDSLKEKED